MAEERAQRQRMLSAAASGNLPLLNAAGTPGGAGGAAASPGLSPGGDAAGLSATELYSRYAEMHERYRAERLKVRQQEIVMEELCAEVEKRAALVQEQQVGAGAGQVVGVGVLRGPAHASALPSQPVCMCGCRRRPTPCHTRCNQALT